MSRFYSVVITDPDSGQIIRPNSLAGVQLPATYTSYFNGKTLANAWTCELDVYVSTYANPVGGSLVRIWGVSNEEISQATDLTGKNIAVYGGMQKGLPLAKAAQSGLLFAGYAFQAFGNRIGTDRTLDLIVNTGTGTIADPKNIVHQWTKGSRLADAISQTLSTAFPGYTADVNISDDLVLTEDDTGYYQTIEQYAQYVKSMSSALLGGTYPGVDVVLKQKTFSVYDGTSETTPIAIAFEDLIGQPTWIESPNIQFKTVMRADIAVGDFVKLPPGLTTITAAAQTSLVNVRTAFQGTFLVNQVRHVGNSRQADAASWVSIFTAAPTQIQSAG